MNYTTHALEAFSKLISSLRRMNRPVDATILESICILLADSPKFLMPAGNKIAVEVKGDAFPLIRLPYPVTVLEYPIDLSVYKSFNFNPRLDQIHKSSKRVVLCIDNTATDLPKEVSIVLAGLILPLKEIRGIYLIAIYHIDEGDEWHMSSGVVFIPLEMAQEESIVYADPNLTSKVSCRVTPLLPSVSESMSEFGMSEEDKLKILQGDIIEDVVSSIKILTCLSARNTMVLDVEAPFKLNKKRLRQGKLPYFEYKVLDVFLTPDARRAVKFTAEQIRSHLMRYSSEAFRRLHSVRGHYKIRKAGIFWWNSFMRGTKAAGEIKKDYEVTKEGV